MHKTLCADPMAVALSSPSGIALRYVLPVLWMTSCLARVGPISVHGLSIVKYSAPQGVAILGRSLMSMNASFCLQVFQSHKFIRDSCYVEMKLLRLTMKAITVAEHVCQVAIHSRL